MRRAPARWVVDLAAVVVLVLLVGLGCKVQAPEEIVTVEGGSYRNIGAEQLYRMLQRKDFLLVNVHIPYEGELPQTDVFVPYNEIEKNIDQFPADRSAKIVLYCRSGRMSAIAAETLVKLGFTNVYNLKQGMQEWKAKGYPLLEKSGDG